MRLRSSVLCCTPPQRGPAQPTCEVAAAPAKTEASWRLAALVRSSNRVTAARPFPGIKWPYRSTVSLIVEWRSCCLTYWMDSPAWSCEEA